MAKKRVVIKTYINTDGTTVTQVNGMQGRGCLSLTQNLTNALSVDGEDVETTECDNIGGFSQKHRQLREQNSVKDIQDRINDAHW